MANMTRMSAMLRELFSETEQRICDDLNFGVGVVYCTSKPREKTTLRRLDNAPQGDKPTRGTHVFFVILMGQMRETDCVVDSTVGVGGWFSFFAFFHWSKSRCSRTFPFGI